MSIFTKDCPVCGTSQPLEAVKCSCGHRFESVSDGETQDLKSIYHEESLYRDYLAARVDEAAKSGDKQTLQAARAELEAQEQRVLAVKKRLKLMRANRHPEKAAAQAPAKSAQPQPSVVVVPPVRLPQPAAKIRPTSPPVSVKPKPPMPAQPSARATATPRTARAGEKPIAPKQAVRAAPKRASNTKARPVAAAKRLVQPMASAPPAAPNTSAKPAPSVQAGAANSAARQECPNCLAKVPVGAARCGCGFEMPGHTDEMPSLSMSPEDRAAFLAALGTTRK